MIFDLIFAFLRSVLTAFLTLIPSYELPGSVQGLGSQLGGATASVNMFFPVVHIGVCIGLLLGVRLFLAVWGVLTFIYDRIPLKGT